MEEIMELTVVKITELEDGSAEVELKMDEETKRYLINYAFNDILSAALSDVEKLHEKGIQVELGD
jgi:acyl-coenzyme A thioesterase PaaI-like protein